MESQNNKNIDNYFKKISEKSQPENFPGMEKIWERVEKKLDKKESKLASPIWKYTGIAASIIILVGVGSLFMKDSSSNIFQSPEDPIVFTEQDTTQKDLNNPVEGNQIVFEDTNVKKEDNENIVVTEKRENTSHESFNSAKAISDIDEASISEDDITVQVEAETEINNARSVSEIVSERISESKTAKQEKPNHNLNAITAGKVAKNVDSGKTITGTVTDDTGLPLPGVNIVIKNTPTGTQTDFDGKYTLNAYVGQTLVFSYVGFETQEKVITTSTTIIDVVMEAGEELSQVVVTGYTVKREKKALGYAVSEDVMEAKSERLRTNTSIHLSGKLPGIKKSNYDENQESYENFTENPFEGASYNPVSTFSIDVDNASYTNIRRFINNGQFVPKDAVRIEEMINFFKYDYPQPKSKHPFTINTEYSDAPWNSNHKLLRIGLQGKEIPTDNLPKSNFVFLVDVSGSMSAANKLPLLKSSMKILLDELRDDDRVSIVYYANNVGVLLEPTKASQKEKIVQVIDGLQASGGTSGGAGIELAYQMAEKNFIKNGNNRIILATDGDFNIGKSSDKEMLNLIEEKRKSGVYLTCLGFGMGNYKDSKMEILANKGNGNYAYIDNIQEANRFLGKEFKGSMFTIAKDVKIQIEFNPNHVQAYRLIGYENRKLRNEDFTNDTIDAGELGSGHTVTALYEIIPVGVKSEFYKNDLDLKYTQNTSNSHNFENEVATVKFRYKKPDEEKSIEMVHPISKNAVRLSSASKDFKFACAVAWFGLKLRDSDLVSNKDSEEILKLAREGLNNDNDGYKAEFIRLVESVK